MGPSWYWMPDVFEQWFARFGTTVKEHYDLVRLDPSYRVFFGDADTWDIPAGAQELYALFDRVEPGAGARLKEFLAEAGMKYKLGMNDLVHRPALRWSEFANARVIAGMMRSTVFTSLRKHVRDRFSDPRLQQLLEFPVLFLGATPERTPALYSLMNYADMMLGTWYPMGGMGRIVDGMVSVAERHGVRFLMDTPVRRIVVEHGRARGVETATGVLRADLVVAGADYHHVETALLPPELRSYSAAYWDSRVMAPSSLLFYLGFDRRLTGLQHHNLFFDRSLDVHAHEIYDAPSWPSDPLMYVCAPSVTDASVAPAGHENVFALIPIAPGLEDTQATRERYLRQVLERIGHRIGVDVRPHVVLQRSYCINDFQADHNAFRGNAYGLANTLRQTAVLKPRMKSRRVSGLYFTGQLTVPGPGVPPSLISGLVVADLIAKEHPLASRRPIHA
jgi:phytoene desaturase